jgi:hypothetical protein
VVQALLSIKKDRHYQFDEAIEERGKDEEV